MRASALVYATTIAALIALAPASAAPNTDIWNAWQKRISQTCPDHHLEWLPGDDYDELPGSFIFSLPKPTRTKIHAIADYSDRCAQETMGFYCEMSVDLDAFQKLGLFDRFTKFACDQRRCEYAAMCAHSTSAGGKT
jgi:hypothetical protein